jgi:hypothetical protein
MFERDQTIKDKQFAGRILLGSLGDKLLVKIQFIPSLAADHYNALQVIFLNRGKGFVDKENFLFRDIIGPQHREDLGEVEPHVWEYGGRPAWFIPITEAQREKIADTVRGYIRLFQSENG